MSTLGLPKSCNYDKLNTLSLGLPRSCNYDKLNTLSGAVNCWSEAGILRREEPNDAQLEQILEVLLGGPSAEDAAGDDGSSPSDGLICS